MGKLKAFLFYWTVASRGARDARKGYPSENDFRQMEVPKGELDLLTALLNSLQKAETAPLIDPIIDFQRQNS